MNDHIGFHIYDICIITRSFGKTLLMKRDRSPCVIKIKKLLPCALSFLGNGNNFESKIIVGIMFCMSMWVDKLRYKTVGVQIEKYETSSERCAVNCSSI